MNAESTRARFLRWFGETIIAACNLAFAMIESTRRLVGRSPVEDLTTEQVQAELASNDPNIVLVDVRSEIEQSVSLICGAITRKDYEAHADRYAGKTIVAYCTVGGRSYLYARKLRSQGIPAMNYRDSILGWIQAGLPLETLEGKPTNRVHPYWKIFSVPGDYEVP